MAKLTGRQKVERVVSFLLGLRDERVAARLVAHGLRDKDVAEGWALLTRTTRVHVEGCAWTGREGQDLFAELNAWRQRWLTIASATLARRAPEAHAYLFEPLNVKDRGDSMPQVFTFLGRFDELMGDKTVSQWDLPTQKEMGARVRTLLAERGFDDKVIAAARELVRRYQHGFAGEDPEASEFGKAEEEAWAWYLEWSRIARVAIQERALLRQLGFLRSSDGEPEPNPTPE